MKSNISMKKIYGIGVVILFWAIILNGNMNNVAASEFSEIYDINNDWIDATKDDFYTLEYNNSDQVSFAYSQVRFALFIESYENITRLQINNTVLTSDYQDASVIVKFAGNRVEFVVMKASFVNPIFTITINNHKQILLDPFDLTIPPTPTTTSTETSTETSTDTNTTTNDTTDGNATAGVDLVKITTAIFTSPVLYLLISIMVVILMDFKRHPIVYLMENGKSKCIGKYVASYYNDKLKKWENYFSDSSGISIYYTALEFNGYAQFLFHTWLGIQYAYPSLRLIQIPVADSNIVKRVPVKKNFKNFILHFIMGFFYFTPAAGLVRKCSDALNCTEVKLEKLPFIIPDIQMDANEYRFKATYGTMEYDAATDSQVRVEHNGENLVYSDIISLEKANVLDLITELHEVRVIHYRSIEEADKDKRSRLELTNNYEKRILDLESEYSQLQDRYQLTLEDLSLLKRDFNEEIYRQLKKVRDLLANQGTDLIEVISDKIEFQKIGNDEIESLREAIKKHSDSTKVDYEKYREENAKLKGILEGLALAEQNKDGYVSNEIIIKNEKSDNKEKDVKKNE